MHHFKQRRARRRGARGQALAELALILPTLLLLVTATIDFGHYLETSNNLVTVIRDGARYVSLNPTNWTNACSGGPQSSGDATCPAGYDTIEGLMQSEANSLTLPAGGINLENADCSWAAGSSTPTAPQPHASCITIAYCQNTLSSGPCTPNVGATYLGDYSVSKNCFISEETSNCGGNNSPAAGDLITVWAAYGYTPLTPVINSVFGLQLIEAKFTVVEEK
jgi:TadE-like protein